MAQKRRILMKVAEIVFGISSDQPLEQIHLGGAWRTFLCTEEPSVTIHASYSAVPDLALRDEDLVFDSEMVWRLYHAGDKNIFVLQPPAHGPLPLRVATFDMEYQSGEVFSKAPEGGGGADASLPDPLEFPLAELLMVNLLARGRGLMTHALGVADNGRGYLFAGNSGHGKSTMAGLWDGKGKILNDDRIVIRQREGRFWMYGTPWHGDVDKVSPEGVPLERVFFLQHAPEAEARRQGGAAAVANLLGRSFLALWDHEGMDFTLDFCARLAQAVPCYELDFAPEADVVDYVRCVK